MGRNLRFLAMLLLICAAVSLFAPLSVTGHWIVAMFLLACAFAALSWAWTFTPDGRLDYRTALSLRLLSVSVPLQPDKAMDFKIRLPINLIFIVDFLLPKVPVHRVEDVAIDQAGTVIPARVYWPSEASAATKPPLIVYYHGGGFVMGSIADYDRLVRALAQATGAMVLAIGYRLAPRHPFPAAVDDALAGLRWAADNAERLGADPDSIFVGGDSAGGNLAVVTCLRTRDEGGPRVAGQILYYPAADLRPEEGKSRRLKNPDAYNLPASAIDAFISAYRGSDGDPADPFMSPIMASDVSGLPPVLMVTAGFDPLTDGAHAYASRLQGAGVTVDLAHYPGTIHGFMSTRVFSQRRDVLARTTAFIEHLSSESGKSLTGEGGSLSYSIPSRAG